MDRLVSPRTVTRGPQRRAHFVVASLFILGPYASALLHVPIAVADAAGDASAGDASAAMLNVVPPGEIAVGMRVSITVTAYVRGEEPSNCEFRSYACGKSDGTYCRDTTKTIFDVPVTVAASCTGDCVVEVQQTSASARHSLLVHKATPGPATLTILGQRESGEVLAPITQELSFAAIDSLRAERDESKDPWGTVFAAPIWAPRRICLAAMSASGPLVYDPSKISVRLDDRMSTVASDDAACTAFSINTEGIHTLTFSLGERELSVALRAYAPDTVREYKALQFAGPKRSAPADVSSLSPQATEGLSLRCEGTQSFVLDAVLTNGDRGLARVWSIGKSETQIFGASVVPPGVLFDLWGVRNGGDNAVFELAGPVALKAVTLPVTTIGCAP
jgi:hypothetical protein